MKHYILTMLFFLAFTSSVSAKRHSKSKQIIAKIEKRVAKISNRYASILNDFEDSTLSSNSKMAKIKTTIVNAGKNYSLFRWLGKRDCDLYFYRFELKLDNYCLYLESLERSFYMSNEFKQRTAKLEGRLQKLLKYIRKTSEFRKDLKTMNQRYLGKKVKNVLLIKR